MSGAMHILGIVVGPESAWLRTSGGYSTSCSPFVQRRVYFSLTVSSKGAPCAPVVHSLKQVSLLFSGG